MQVMKIGKYTVTGRMAEDVTEEDKERSLIMLRDAIWQQIQIDRKKEGR